MQIPALGTKVSVTPESFTHLKTTAPVLRLRCEDGTWYAADPNEMKGLIVFVRHPKEVIVNIKEVEIVSVESNVAFAVASNLITQV
jgi:hypothetical protein